MISRFYAHNFRTLVNFDVAFDSMTLVMGPNGAGKSAVFDALWLVREFLRGERTTSDLFAHASISRLLKSDDVQSFELSLSVPAGEYHYQLAIEHDLVRQKSRVQTERLTFGAETLYESQLRDGALVAQLYRDDGRQGPMVFTDGTRSTIAGIVIPETGRMNAFTQRMERLAMVRLNPAIIAARAEEESSTLARDGSNFVAWFRHVQSLDLELASRLRSQLAEVLPGLESIGLAPDGITAKVLRTQFLTSESANERQSVVCRFDELSDGERALFILYTLLLSATEDSTICIDEPENFLALREINPWLNMLLDKTQTQSCQAILISHHPELIDALAVGAGRWLDRAAGGHTRVQPVTNDATGLSVSELVSRGWLHAQ